MKKQTKLKELNICSLKLDLKMKLTIYLFLFSLFQINASTYSQKTKVTLKLKNVRMEKVFREIESQTEFKILYNNNELNGDKLVSVHVENVLVANVFKELFLNTNIDYKTIGKQIVIVQNKVNHKRLSSITQQKIEIKGTVTGDDGIPVPGASVMVKGSSIGTISDFDGNYQISVNDKNAVLVFSFVGYKTREINVNGLTTIDVILENDINELNTVVVVGYGTVKKSDITGSLSSIDTEKLNVSQTSSVAQAIQGRAAGVSVSKSSGQPGSTPTVRIRGIGTVGNADPLYIVDGVPINDITSINMADAKSVEVLKDASATAIYGSRGANGVILITTKGGVKNKKTSISYKTYSGIEKKISNLKVLDAEQWATIYNEGKVNDGAAIDPDLSNPASLTTNNWKDAVYRNGRVESHQLSVSGGNDKSTYYLSFGQFSQKGIIKNTSFKRTNFRINNTYQIKPKIKVGQNIQYANSKSNSVAAFGSNSNFKTGFVGYVVDPVSPTNNSDGSPASPLYSTQIKNPVGLATYNQSPLIKEVFLGNVFAEFEILKGLSLKSNYGLEVNNRKIDNFESEYFISVDQNRALSQYRLNRSENRTSVWSNTLNYSTVFNNEHTFNFLLGHETQTSDSNNVNATRSGIPESIANPTLSSGSVDSSTSSGGISSSELLSFFGRVNYNFNQKYLLYEYV